jgi:hypothetical protein
MVSRAGAEQFTFERAQTAGGYASHRALCSERGPATAAPIKADRPGSTYFVEKLFEHCCDFKVLNAGSSEGSAPA